ncbi:MAG: hypothetical protein H6Q21_1404, partial [Bacteroidetes bacterium]|nr:hypothetical protein [Bacteroidota bacterium]
MGIVCIHFYAKSQRIYYLPKYFKSQILL